MSPDYWLLFRFIELMKAAESGNSVAFETIHDDITNVYKTLSVMEQGYFHESVCKWMMK